MYNHVLEGERPRMKNNLNPIMVTALILMTSFKLYIGKTTFLSRTTVLVAGSLLFARAYKIMAKTRTNMLSIALS
jgi:hypothetical protein